VQLNNIFSKLRWPNIAIASLTTIVLHLAFKLLCAFGVLIVIVIVILSLLSLYVNVVCASRTIFITFNSNYRSNCCRCFQNATTVPSRLRALGKARS